MGRSLDPTRPHTHDRAAAVRHIDLIWPATCWSGYSISPRVLTGTVGVSHKGMGWLRLVTRQRQWQCVCVDQVGRSGP
jgi:hypothetical protein